MVYCHSAAASMPARGAGAGGGGGGVGGAGGSSGGGGGGAGGGSRRGRGWLRQNIERIFARETRLGGDGEGPKVAGLQPGAGAASRVYFGFLAMRAFVICETASMVSTPYCIEGISSVSTTRL